jgi:hypothetical protein
MNPLDRVAEGSQSLLERDPCNQDSSLLGPARFDQQTGRWRLASSQCIPFLFSWRLAFLLNTRLMRLR